MNAVLSVGVVISMFSSNLAVSCFEDEIIWWKIFVREITMIVRVFLVICRLNLHTR